MNLLDLQDTNPSRSGFAAAPLAGNHIFKQTHKKQVSEDFTGKKSKFILYLPSDYAHTLSAAGAKKASAWYIPPVVSPYAHFASKLTLEAYPYRAYKMRNTIRDESSPSSPASSQNSFNETPLLNRTEKWTSLSGARRSVVANTFAPKNDKPNVTAREGSQNYQLFCSKYSVPLLNNTKSILERSTHLWRPSVWSKSSAKKTWKKSVCCVDMDKQMGR